MYYAQARGGNRLWSLATGLVYRRRGAVVPCGANGSNRLLAAVCRQTRETNSPVSTDNRTHSSLEPHSALLFIERCGCRIFDVVVQQMNFTNDVLDQRRHSA